ncbi:MAG: helicase [Polyangiaceae bacterium]|nr:helicase [Polyangiaceae bacterium]
MIDASALTAVLGPTNTGKTHRAVERMLEHPTGMIGLPLRLLAREVYDRLTARIGEARVALVTGEEKRVPRRPDYWVCTVEAMPLSVEVDFLAIDEVQLAADAQRGHVFTARLLGARGRRETWLLGAGTMRGLAAELVPTARVREYPRLSRLGFAGASKLSRLPPRSAVVAFSIEQVHELAERLCALRGGAAVVLGALSPRTRNAQVAMFQAGEVDFLVATDAIGMGLNLDVDHVAFAALRKFDGHEPRPLEGAELGQIAGRAGRYLRDGTFGTVAPLELPDPFAQAVEGHRFAPVERLWWRNPDLDTSSLAALTASLRRAPPSRRLRLVEDAEDSAVLGRLALLPEVRALATRPEAVELLWQVCRVPDFRKLLLESHAALLADVFVTLAGPRAVLDNDWIAPRVRAIDEPEGDVDDLLARIAAIRTFTYLAHQPGWLAEPAEWQARTRAVEDRLSDALHARLVLRFVDRRGKRRSRARGLPATPPRPAGAGARFEPGAGSVAAPSPAPRASQRGGAHLPDPSHPFAALAELRAVRADPRSGVGRPESAWLEALVAAPHERFRLELAERGDARVAFEGREVGRLVRGATLLRPEVRLAGLDEVGQGARLRVQRRLAAFARDVVEGLVAVVRPDPARVPSAARKGIAYQLEQGLGTVDARAAALQRADLSPGEVAELAVLGVTLGARVLYLRSAQEPRALGERAALVAVFHGTASAPQRPGVPSFAAARDADRSALLAAGYVLLGRRAVRADVCERVAGLWLRSGPADPPPREKLARLLGCAPRDVRHVLDALEPDEAFESESAAQA